MADLPVHHGAPLARELTPAEAEALTARAHECEREIVRACQGIRTAGIFLAKHLYEFVEERYWQLLGYESLNAFLASPDIELQKTQVMKLKRIYGELVVSRGAEPSTLAGVDLNKLDAALPALKTGKTDVQSVISDAKALTRDDFERLYRQNGGRDAPLDAEAEPARVQCPTCQQWTTEDRLP